jgi:hypothetical protein
MLALFRRDGGIINASDLGWGSSAASLERLRFFAAVTSFAGHQVANPARRVWHVPLPPRDQVNVAVENRLARRRAGVDADVEPLYGGVGLLGLPLQPFEKAVNGIQFRPAEIEIAGDVPLRDDQRVAGRYRNRYHRAPSVIASSMAGRPICRPAELVFIGTTSLYGQRPSQYDRIVRANREVDYGWVFMGNKRRENYDN